MTSFIQKIKEIKEELTQLPCMVVEDEVFKIGRSVYVIGPSSKSDKSFPKGRVETNGNVKCVRLESIDKIKVVEVIFSDGETDFFFPSELNVSLF